MSYDSGIGNRLPNPLTGTLPTYVPAWNEIEQQFSQGPSLISEQLQITLMFDTNVITTTLQDCAQTVQSIVMDAFDAFFTPAMLNTIWHLIPTRTGKLADLLMQSILIYALSNSRTFTINAVHGYPLIINNTRHTSEIGYGNKYTPTYTSPLINKLRDTANGAYYALNDPVAESDYIAAIQNYIYSSMYQLILYLDNVNFRAIASIKQSVERVALSGTTTLYKQHTMRVEYSSGRPILGDVSVTTEQKNVVENIWKQHMWNVHTYTSNLGDYSLQSVRVSRYKWLFTIDYRATITQQK